MRKERELIIKVIQNKGTSYHRLSDFFARKYSEKNRKKKDGQKDRP